MAYSNADWSAVLKASDNSSKNMQSYYKQRDKEEEKKKKKVYDSLDNYRDENDNLHIGDKTFTDNGDYTFTSSDGKTVSLDELKKDATDYSSSQDTTEKKKPGLFNDGGALGGVGDFFQGIGEGAWKGGAGLLGSGASLVSSVVAGSPDNAVTDATKDWQESADKWGKSVNANGVGEFVGNLPGGIVSGVVDPASYMVRGVRNLPEGIAADIAASSSDRYVRQEGIKAQKELQERQFGKDVAERGDGAMLAEGIAKPGEAILNVVTGGLGGSLTENVAKQGLKQGWKDIAKTGGKMGLLNMTAGTPLQILEEHSQGQEINAATVSKDALTQFGLGFTLGAAGRAKSVKENNANVKAGEAMDEQMTAAKASRDKKAKEDEDYQTSRKSEFDEIMSNRANGLNDDGSRMINLDDTKSQIEDMQNSKFTDDLYDVTDTKGNPVDDTFIQEATKKQVDALTAKRDQIQKQVDSIEDSTAKESAMKAVNDLNDKIDTLQHGGTAELMNTEGSGITRQLNSDKVKEKWTSLQDDLKEGQARADYEKGLAQARDRDNMANTGKSAEQATAELDAMRNGEMPANVMKPMAPVKDAVEIADKQNVPQDAREAAQNIVMDASTTTRVLDSLMTPQKRAASLDALDQQYKAQADAIAKMPPQRQEVEMNNLEEWYGSEMGKIDDQVKQDAPQVDKYTTMLQGFQDAEAELVQRTNDWMRENPGAAVEPDPKAVLQEATNIAQAQHTAEITKPTSPSNGALIGAVDNHVKPTDSTNPRVQQALDDNGTKLSDTVDMTSTGKDPGFLDYMVSSKRAVIAKFGSVGKTISKVLGDAYDAVAIRDQSIAVQTHTWMKAAGGKNGMREVAKALDGDTNALTGLNENQVSVYNQVRDMFKAYADEMGLPEGARISDYLPHMFKDQTLDSVDRAVMQLSTGKGLDGKELTPKQISELQTQIRGLDYEAIAMVKRNSLYKVKNGFLEKRTGAEGYSIDLPEIILAYTHAAHNTIHMKPALERVKPLSTALSGAQNKYLAETILSLGGKPTDELAQMLNVSLDSLFKRGDNLYSKGSQKARKLIYDGMIGGNIGSAVRNLSQGGNTYAKLGEKYYGVGTAKALASFNHNSGGYNELLHQGVLTNKFSDYLRADSPNAIREGFDRGLWAAFSSTEQINRATAYFGAKQRYIDRYVKSETKAGRAVDPTNLPDEVVTNAMKAGREMSRKTQFEFGKFDTSMFADNETIKNIIQFQSYNIQQVKFLKNMVAGDSDAMFVKNPKGGYKMTVQGTMAVARYIGYNSLFMATVGSAIGMTWQQQVPFLDDLMEGTIPKSPITQLLVGDDEGKNGLIGLAYGKTDVGKFAGSLFASLAPGGTQMKKTYEGLSSVDSGKSTNASGSTRFLQDQDAVNTGKAALFGQYNTDAGQQWLKNGMQTFSEKQSKTIDEQDSETTKQQYADFFKLSKAAGKRSARDDIEDTFNNRGTNAAMRKTQEYNAKVDSLENEYRKMYPGALPKEISDQLKSLRITYKNLDFTKGSD